MEKGSAHGIRQNTDEERKGTGSETYSLARDVCSLAIKVAVIIAAFILLFTFVYGVERMADDSMKPSLTNGDMVLYYRFDKHFVAGDVCLLSSDGQMQVRRVVATAGDTVDISEEGLLINGALQLETEIYAETKRYTEGVNFPLTVGEGQIFVLADARTDTVDSRFYGAIDSEDTYGKAITVVRRRNI